MADAVDSNVIISGGNNYSIQLTNVSDRTGESDVIKINKSDLTGPVGVEPNSIKIESIQFSVKGFDNVVLEWDGSTATPIAVMSGNNFFDWWAQGGKVDDASGGTGDILLTTNGATATSSYDITINCKLKGSV